MFNSISTISTYLMQVRVCKTSNSKLTVMGLVNGAVTLDAAAPPSSPFSTVGSLNPPAGTPVIPCPPGSDTRGSFCGVGEGVSVATRVTSSLSWSRTWHRNSWASWKEPSHLVYLKNLPPTASFCSYIFLVVLEQGLYVVLVWKWRSGHVLGGVIGVTSFITTDEQLQ